MPMTSPRRDPPWIFRTYAGHSDADASNALFRSNLSRGQTGLSVAFDLPTQTGYDADHPSARGEVGRVGVPIGNLGDMRRLFADIPLDRMNTSMTINAPAAWLLSLYAAHAEERGVSRSALSGTVQNDVFKEYLSRGTYIFPPRASLRLSADVIAFASAEMPKWNPINVCSYHLQEAGATPSQEIAYALASAIEILDALRERDDVGESDFPFAAGRISFFVNSGLRLVTEICKLRAFGEMWDEIGRDRYGIEEARLRRFRYGVQVNSLGLTEGQPENNILRILLEALPTVLSKRARARAVQLPAWNEALGLPRPWDQQWSLRAQQILAFETDLLEHEDIFDGSRAIESRTSSLKAEALEELNRVVDMGGATSAIESGYMKERLARSLEERVRRIESGEESVVGVNAFVEGEPSPLVSGDGGAAPIEKVSEDVEFREIERLARWRSERDSSAVSAALDRLRRDASEGLNVMPSSLEAARCGVTTGEWADVLREVFGEYRAPTGIESALRSEFDPSAESDASLRSASASLSSRLGRRPRLVIGKVGLDGHSNGAEQLALRAHRAGFEVFYEGIRCSASRVAELAAERDADVVGLSALSGAHISAAREALGRMRELGLSDVPLAAGGIVPSDDEAVLRQLGVSEVYTPKDFRVSEIVMDLFRLAERRFEDRAA